MKGKDSLCNFLWEDKEEPVSTFIRNSICEVIT